MIARLNDIKNFIDGILQAHIGTVEQLWISVCLFAMFVIGLIIYYCYSKSIGFHEGWAHGRN